MVALRRRNKLSVIRIRSRPQTLWSSGDGVLVEKSAESVDSADPRRVVESPPRDIGDGHLEIDPTMRSRCVVVLDELFEDALEMTLASDEQPVEALGPCGANEALGERVGTRRADRGLDHSGTNRCQHFIEGPDELGISISDQELDDPAFVLECHCEIARLLSDPDRSEE